MPYVQGFLIPVSRAREAAYLEQARGGARIFLSYGATRVVETWGDDVPDGKVTDFRRAVLAEAGEEVVFSWIEWPDKATCEAAKATMESDPQWADLGDMPFDGKRMIFAGFVPILDTADDADPDVAPNAAGS